MIEIMNMKLKQCRSKSCSLHSASVIMLLLIMLLVSLPVLASAAYGGVISQSDSFYVADEADVISSDTEKYIIDKNAELEQLGGGQIGVATVDFLDGMDIEDYAYKLFKDWKIGDEDRDNGILLLLAIGEENYWCMQGKGLEGTLTSGDIDHILWNYLEDDFAAGDYDSGVRSVFDALYGSVADIYGSSGEYDGSSDSSAGYDYTSAASDFARIIKIALIVFLVVLVLLIITSIFFGRRNRSLRRSRNRTRPIFIPTSRPPRPPRPPRPSVASRSSRPARTSRTSSSGSRSGSSRSSFGGGSRSTSRGGGMGRGGGGSSRGGGAGRRGR